MLPVHGKQNNRILLKSSPLIKTIYDFLVLICYQKTPNSAETVIPSFSKQANIDKAGTISDTVRRFKIWILEF